MPPRRISELPHALREGQRFAALLAGRRPAVFLDYDGTLTPIVDRPEDAVISEDMREVVRDLAGRTTVCVVSGRDRPAIARWMQLDGLVIAGSHGFDLGDVPGDEHGAGLPHDAAPGIEDLLATVISRLRAEVEQPLPGALVEPKRFSVAVHYRLVADAQRPAVTAAVDALLADHPGRLRLTPGKLVYEIQPNLDWDKGRAVQYLRHTLHVDGAEFAPLYLGDDITDEDAFRALHGPGNGQGIGVIVTDGGDPAQTDRSSNADFVLNSIGEVQRFLDTLAR